MAAKRASSKEKPLVVDFDEAKDRLAPIARPTVQSVAASQAATRGLTLEQTQRHVAATLDVYDSYWSRDPGRAHGPYT